MDSDNFSKVILLILIFALVWIVAAAIISPLLAGGL